MDVRITTLSENTANYGFLGEWGLSILVEADGVQVLMDTGLNLSAAYNAQVMRLDLSTIDRIVLSHGHADHTGGLCEVLRLTGAVEIIAHPDIWVDKFTRRSEGNERKISIPFSQKELEDLGARFNLTREPIRITGNIMTTGEIPMITDYEEIDSHLFIREGDEFKPDPLADDLALVIDTEFGLVVILGCAHRGMVNTLRHAQTLTGRERVYAVIGGTHLIGASEERLERTIADLREMDIQRLGVSHCTGFPASARLAQEFADTFFLNNAGSRMALP
ncbi:MAG TPA: MBL fold metallo-hydrolase [Dehalococcoidia bacterium]|nr:MBL fold metallo-hydrolase [Dehalococcoidia bacterium]